jgi:DNA repair protein RadC
MIRVTTRRYTFQLVHDVEPVYPVRAEVTCSRDVARIAGHVIGAEITECLLAFFLDARYRVAGYAEIARGTLNATRFLPRDVLTPALHAGSCALAIAHNHPSNSPEASRPDRLVTTALRNACELVGIPLVDHVIVTSTGGHHSFRDAEGWD